MPWLLPPENFYDKKTRIRSVWDESLRVATQFRNLKIASLRAPSCSLSVTGKPRRTLLDHRSHPPSVIHSRASDCSHFTAENSLKIRLEHATPLPHRFFSMITQMTCVVNCFFQNIFEIFLHARRPFYRVAHGKTHFFEASALARVNSGGRSTPHIRPTRQSIFLLPAMAQRKTCGCRCG